SDESRMWTVTLLCDLVISHKVNGQRKRTNDAMLPASGWFSEGAFRPRVHLLWSESGTNFVRKLDNCLELVHVLKAAFTSRPDQMPCARKLLLIGQNFHVGKIQEVKQTLKKSTLAR
ncbi:hypothetical protein P3578_24200, partial [Vibrio parahaemolyticus]|nr:hypothetical protein [Vibrio parahaemolyticus]